MEAMYFAVGVLTMVLLAVASLAVFSTVTVLKLKKKFEEQTRFMHDDANNMYRNINEREDRVRRELNEVNEHLHRIFDEFRSYVDRQFENTQREMHEIGDQMLRNHDSLRSYVDHRFDKLVDTYLLVKETEKESKKLIKG